MKYLCVALEPEKLLTIEKMSNLISSANELLTMPLWQMSGEQFLTLYQTLGKENQQPVSKVEKRYLYGIIGISEIFGCSISTANRIKKSGKLDKAITQLGRKVIIDVDMALELAGKKNGGRR